MTEYFAWAPVTLERDGVVYPILVGLRAYYEPDQTELGGPNGMVIVAANAEGRDVPVGDIIAKNSEEFRFLTPAGNLAVIRATRPDDALRSEQFPNSFDLPVEVIGAIVSDTINAADNYVSAAVDDQGDVHTVVLVTPLGLYARYSMQWIKLTDVAAISHLNMIDIAPDDVDAYDDADTNGQMVNISGLNPVKGEAIEYIAGPAPEPVVASAPTRAVVIASIDDVPAAIRYAQSDEGWGSRWYVGRRAKALGWKEPLPWE